MGKVTVSHAYEGLELGTGHRSSSLFSEVNRQLSGTYTV